MKAGELRPAHSYSKKKKKKKTNLKMMTLLKWSRIFTVRNCQERRRREWKWTSTRNIQFHCIRG